MMKQCTLPIPSIAQKKGFYNTKNLPRDATGLLFVPSPSTRAVWVQRCRFDVDSGDVIDRDVIILRQCNDQRKRYFPFSLFIVGICGLVHPKNMNKLFLRQVTIFSKVS